ncbi:MAG: response regulator [Planctomycetota bacterium]
MKSDEAWISVREAVRRSGARRDEIERWIEQGLLETEPADFSQRNHFRVDAISLWELVHRKENVARPDKHTPALRVLVVEDEKRLAGSIRRVLLRSGYEVRTASDGFKAGKLLAAFRPAVVTLDLRMPVLHGQDVMSLLKCSPLAGTFRVLVISAEGDDAIAEALAIGADDFLEKPFANDALIAKVDSLMPHADFIAEVTNA